MQKILLAVFLSFIFSLAFAVEPAKPLPAEQAFVLTTYTDKENNLKFQWNIAPGYYLYENKFHFTLSSLGKMKIGPIAWPKGFQKTNSEGVVIPIYSGSFNVIVPVVGQVHGPITLTVGYQGCSMDGFCYAPVEKNLKVDLSTLKPLQDLTQNVTMVSAERKFVSDQGFAERIFAGHNIFFIVLSFLGLGLLLAFTPCVLPMVPILSSIIVGHKKHVSTFFGFSLSLVYVLGMAVTYAIAGIVVASLGSSIQALFQKPWIIVLFSLLFVLLSLSLFGLYDLQLPARWHKHTTHISNRLRGGTYLGVFFMGCLATLIVSPCVSAPLVGVLAYIAQTGDRLLGGVALLMLGLGMGLPLLVIGTSAGKWLPKSGHWMGLIKKLFGILMLGTAVWMISRIIPGSMALMLWSFLCVGTGLYLGVFCREVVEVRTWFRIIGSCLLVYGIILIVGAAIGNSDPLRPWDGWNTSHSIVPDKKDFFTTVKTTVELDDALAEAKKNNQPVILDFYATWCFSCVVMDHHVFAQMSVHRALSSYARIRVDVTKNDLEHRAIMKRYHVVAPPTILLFDAEGKEQDSERIVGEMNATEFLNHLNKVKE